MANDIDTGHGVARYTRLRQDPTHHWILPDNRAIRATNSTTLSSTLFTRPPVPSPPREPYSLIP